MDTIVAKAGYLYIVGYIYRPGCTSFACILEHTRYPPDTALNELYNMYLLKYSGSMHLVIEIPSSKENYNACQEIATQNGLRLVSGKPWNGITEFPVKCAPDACFTLETLDHEQLAGTDIKSLLLNEVEDLKDRYVNNI